MTAPSINIPATFCFSAAPDGKADIVSRKNTQLAEVEVATGIGYLNELSEKYKPGTKIPNTAKNVQLKIAGQRLSGPQILEVPVQTAPVPKKLLDKAKAQNSNSRC